MSAHSHQTPEERLQELTLTLPTPPQAVAVYLPFKRSGDKLFISGQIATQAGRLAHQGRVGEGVSLEEGRACAELCALNLLAQVKVAIGELSRVRQVVKINVFVASAPDFTEQHLVANGASELLGAVLGEAGRHARSAVGVVSLPLNTPVEIDAVFEVE